MYVRWEILADRVRVWLFNNPDTVHEISRCELDKSKVSVPSLLPTLFGQHEFRSGTSNACTRIMDWELEAMMARLSNLEASQIDAVAMHMEADDSDEALATYLWREILIDRCREIAPVSRRQQVVLSHFADGIAKAYHEAEQIVAKNVETIMQYCGQ
jgi:hypothetical protein